MTKSSLSLTFALTLIFAQQADSLETKSFPNHIHELLGPWAWNETKLAELNQLFTSADPFPHVAVEGFFSSDVAERIENRFPVPNGSVSAEWVAQGWHVYDNPIEGKLAHDNVQAMSDHDPVFASMWRILQSKEMLDIVKKITSIPDLESDPYLHGAGLHYHPRGSRLEMHLDYSIHPITRKERRVNLIIYMNPTWSLSWGGHLQLWEGSLEGMKRFATRVAPQYNTAVLFRTSDASWHGMPDPISCPQGMARKSVAIYYVSEPRPGATPRHKAAFRPRPGHRLFTVVGEDSSRQAPAGEPGLGEEDYVELCKRRDSRLIESKDLEELVPSWRPRWQGQAPAAGAAKADGDAEHA